MEELYSETYLKAKPSPKRTAVRLGLIFLCLFLVVFDLMVLKSLYLLIFVFIVDAMIIYFLPKKNVAYEYVFVDGQIESKTVGFSSNIDSSAISTLEAAANATMSITDGVAAVKYKK